MGETTDRLELIRARREAGDDADAGGKMDTVLSRANIVWGVLFTVLFTMFVIGRSVMTKDEAEKAFVRQDVYQRDHEHTTKQLDTIETKLDRVAEAINARP